MNSKFKANRKLRDADTTALVALVVSRVCTSAACDRAGGRQ
jgi:hypothetical protein